MKVVRASAFDPALSDPKSTLPTRLEILVDDVDLESPTYADVDNPNFTVTHYGKLMKIFSELSDWDEDDTELCAAIYNTVSGSPHQVVPVTVATPTFSLWEVYYMRVDKVRALLALDPAVNTPGYELLPDPTYIEQGKFGWYFQHKMRLCSQCYFDSLNYERLPGGDSPRVPKLCTLVKVSAHRLTSMCQTHRRDYNSRMAAIADR